MIYPERLNTEIIYINEMIVDLCVRVELIKRAKYTIDIITFSQATDETGLIFLDAIRSVQIKKKVKVRFVYDHTASWIDKDFFNRSGKIMVDKKCQAKVQSISLYNKRTGKISWDDFYHEKLLLIDADTKDEKLIVGGRGYTDFSTLTADSAYIFRPIDSKEYYIGTDVKHNFNKIFSEISKISKTLKNSKSIKYSVPQGFKGNDHKDKIDEITNHLSKPVDLSKPLKEYQFIPDRAQLLSNDVISNIVVSGEKVKNREILPNDSHDTLIADIDNFKGTIDLTSYSIGFPQPLFKAFVRFIQRGNTLNLITNGKKAHKEFVWFGTPFLYTLETLHYFLLKTKDMKGTFNVFYLDVEKARSLNEKTFVHRKLILFQNSNITYTGTDNFTWSSSKKNNDWLIKICDEKLNKHLQEVIGNELKWYRKAEKKELMEKTFKRNLLYKLTRRLIISNY
ncbi:MAG: phosphatidylserine/phosphatidylglycerophosphate/cardiolipin synthase family protein [Desulfobacterales bacterium]|nr:phosphatidylserine/phosphatidylglycerophosphate/cardiolipin synthase family protein [Desulfobacterales bacterium]